MNNDSNQPNITESWQGHFLIATPSLTDTVFSNTMVYLCEHTPEGSMGLVVNQPLDISLDEIFNQFDLEFSKQAGAQPLLSGGPVQVNRGFVLHPQEPREWESTQQISSDIYLTSSRDIIDDIARDKGPTSSLITLGYAGWGAGQLEAELSTNAWLMVPATSQILFEMPAEKRREAATASLGFNLDQLGSSAGHA